MTHNIPYQTYNCLKVLNKKKFGAKINVGTFTLKTRSQRQVGVVVDRWKIVMYTEAKLKLNLKYNSYTTKTLRE